MSEEPIRPICLPAVLDLLKETRPEDAKYHPIIRRLPESEHVEIGWAWKEDDMTYWRVTTVHEREIRYAY